MVVRSESVWIEADTYLLGATLSLDDVLKQLMISIENQALALRDHFREERKRIVEAERLTLQDEGVDKAKGAKSTYTPLNLFARLRKGNLEIYWQEVHRRPNTPKPKYTYLPRGEDGNYNRQKLRGKARHFEAVLVDVTEQRAAYLRNQWKTLMALRQHHRTMETAVKRQRSPTVDTPTPVIHEPGRAPTYQDLVPAHSAMQ